MQKYIFKKYNPEFKDFFILEEGKINKVLSDFGIKVEHIGSTAIPGLGGKGIIDILIGSLPSDLLKIKVKLENWSYEFREKASYPDRLFFRIDYPYVTENRRVHIHLLEFNGEEWNDFIFLEIIYWSIQRWWKDILILRRRLWKNLQVMVLNTKNIKITL